MKSVTLLGRLGKDPETRFTSSGQAVTNFSIATDESYKDKSGVKQKKTAWHRCLAWGKTGETIAQYFKKGGLILVVGKIEYRDWDDKGGVKRTSTEINVFQFHFAGDNGGDSSERPAPAPAGGEVSDDDIPF